MGDLERAVMEVLWDAGDKPQTVRAVFEELERDRQIAYTTVMTVLDRLGRKGVVSQTKEGRAHLYRPVASRAEMAAELMHETLAEFTSNDRDQALVAFLSDASPADLVALREALDRLGA